MTVADFIVLLLRSSCCCWLHCAGCFWIEKEIAPSPASPLSCALRGQGGYWGWEIDAGALYRALGGVHSPVLPISAWCLNTEIAFLMADLKRLIGNKHGLYDTDRCKVMVVEIQGLMLHRV